MNILSGIPSMESPNTEVRFDQDGARALLDEAGWALDGDVRKKDGVELSIDYMTTNSQLRQKIQAIVKSNLEDVGFKVELKQVPSEVFFDSGAGNDQNNTHFYNDLNMFTSGIGAPPPVAYMLRWYAGPNGDNIAQASNSWTGRNFQRYNNPEYDAQYEASRTESDPDRQNELFISMNDILYNDAAVMPLVRIGSKIAVSQDPEPGEHRAVSLRVRLLEHRQLAHDSRVGRGWDVEAGRRAIAAPLLVIGNPDCLRRPVRSGIGWRSLHSAWCSPCVTPAGRFREELQAIQGRVALLLVHDL